MRSFGLFLRFTEKATRLRQRRLVAVLGDLDALTPRLWAEARRQGLQQASQVVWLSDGGRGFWRLCEERFARHATGILDFTMRPNTCGRLRQLGWMDAPAKPGDGLPGRGTVSDMGCRTASSPTWRTPGTWRDCARD